MSCLFYFIHAPAKRLVLGRPKLMPEPLFERVLIMRLSGQSDCRKHVLQSGIYSVIAGEPITPAGATLQNKERKKVVSSDKRLDQSILLFHVSHPLAERGRLNVRYRCGRLEKPDVSWTSGILLRKLLAEIHTRANDACYRALWFVPCRAKWSF